MNESNDLCFYARNNYSQRGHDGIIEKIMFELGIDKGFFVEFGAWDGIHLSNTRFLFEKGWGGCYIEANPVKYAELCKNYSGTNVICLNEFIFPTASEGGVTLDEIYNEHLVASHQEIDLLSIDVDGQDYEILENLIIKPKLIVIEGGFAWSPHLKDKVPYEIARNNIGQPLHVIIECGKAKGYQPICFNQDVFLLRNDLYFGNNFFGQINQDPVSLWMSAFNNIFNEEERQWLIQWRNETQVVRDFERGRLHLGI